MHREDKFVLGGDKRFNKEDLYLKGYSKGWDEKLTFTVGISYLSSGLFGLIFPPTKRIISSVARLKLKPTYASLESMSRTANTGACASLLFCVTRKFLDLVFEEELNDLSHQQKLLLTGGVSGALYKCSLGLRPMVVGSIFGVGFIFTIAQGLNMLNKRGYVNFSLDF
mmetsp:Transcript_20379/g.38147  ORF Transcript_20379/g.38147 Transcript_20379/m.38147 type:complete len:168 (+) Transcript_20379:5240-5743(+)